MLGCDELSRGMRVRQPVRARSVERGSSPGELVQVKVGIEQQEQKEHFEDRGLAVPEIRKR